MNDSSEPRESTSQSDIPFELLAYIFRLASSVDIPFGIFTRLFVRQSLSLSQVCRQWRVVAISEPLLWRYIDCSIQPRAIFALLDRSGSHTPLHICVHAVAWNGRHLNAVLDILTPAVIQRLESLQVRLDDRSRSSVWYRLASRVTPAPRLEYLAVEVASDRTVGFRNVDTSSFTNIFDGHLPALQRILLRDVPVPISGNVLRKSSLTHLDIALPEARTVVTPFNEELLYDMIKTPLHLQYLSLRVGLRTPLTTDDPDPISLSDLEDLEVGITSHNGDLQTRLLRTIRTNARVSISLARSSRLRSTDIHHFPAWMNTRAAVIDSESTKECVVLRGYIDPDDVRPSALRSTSTSTSMSGLQITARSPPRPSLEMLISLLDPRSVEALTFVSWTLDIDFIYALSRDTTRSGSSPVATTDHVLPVLRALRELHFTTLDCNFNTIGVGRLLRAFTASTPSILACPYPRLRKLTVETSKEEQWTLADVEDLGQCVESRVKAGAPLKEITVNCPPKIMAIDAASRIRQNVGILTLTYSVTL